MDVPQIVSEALGDEGVAAHVPLKGDDAIYVTQTRSIRYSEEGLLSDESVDEYPHDAERVSVSEGRRKATIQLDYGTEGTRQFAVPPTQLETALHPVLAGVLNASGVTGPGETVKRTFRFSELTLVVTSDRLVKHIGSAVWDREYEEIPYDEVTGVSVEEGNVSSQLVLKTPTRTQRIKAPNESFREVRETIEDALFAFHGVDSVAAFEELMADDEDDATESVAADVSFEDGVEPIGGTDSANGDAAADATDELAEGGFTSAAATVEAGIDPEELATELDALEESIGRQLELLETQQAWIDEMRAFIRDR